MPRAAYADSMSDEDLRSILQENEELRRRLELYRWTLAATLFVMIALIVAR